MANRYDSHRGYGFRDDSRLRSPKCENRVGGDVVGFAEGGGSYITHCGLYAGAATCGTHLVTTRWSARPGWATSPPWAVRSMRERGSTDD